MPNYLFVYYGMDDDEALQEKEMEIWTAWFDKLGKAVVDMGAPTKPGKTNQ